MMLPEHCQVAGCQIKRGHYSTAAKSEGVVVHHRGGLTFLTLLGTSLKGFPMSMEKHGIAYDIEQDTTVHADVEVREVHLFVRLDSQVALS